MAYFKQILMNDRGVWNGNTLYRLFDMVSDPANSSAKYMLKVLETAGVHFGDLNKWQPVEVFEDDTTERDALIAVVEKTGSGVVSGLAVSAQETPDLTVALTAGVCYLPSGLRCAFDAIEALTVATVEAHKNRAARIYVSSLGVVSVASALGTIAVAGAKTYTITTNAVATDTVTLVGVEFAAVASEATGNQFNVGTDAAATAANLAAVLAANETVDALYAVTVDGAAITLTEKAWGGGNTPANATKTGTIVIANGAATTSAAAGAASIPATPTGGLTLATVAVAAAATTIVTGNITKNRAMLVSDAIFKTE